MTDPIIETAKRFSVGDKHFPTYLHAALYLKQLEIYKCYPNHAKNV